MGICCQGWACLDIPGHFDAGYLGDGLGVLQQLQGASCRAQGEATSERWGWVIPNHQPGSVRRGTHFTVRGGHRVRSQIQSPCGSQGDQDVLLDGVGLDRLQGPGSSLAWPASLCLCLLLPALTADAMPQSLFLSALSAHPDRSLSVCWEQHCKLLPGVAGISASAVAKWNIDEVRSDGPSLFSCPALPSAHTLKGKLGRGPQAEPDAAPDTHLWATTPPRCPQGRLRLFHRPILVGGEECAARPAGSAAGETGLSPGLPLPTQQHREKGPFRLIRKSSTGTAQRAPSAHRPTFPPCFPAYIPLATCLLWFPRFSASFRP